MIEESEHFVYMENQFFITSSVKTTAACPFRLTDRRTVVNIVRVENEIGDALVERIIRAHREGTPWKACIVLPLLPGFTYPLDHSDASAVRPRVFPRSWSLKEFR